MKNTFNCIWWHVSFMQIYESHFKQTNLWDWTILADNKYIWLCWEVTFSLINWKRFGHLSLLYNPEVLLSETILRVKFRIKDVRTNCFCSSLLRTKFSWHATSCIERAREVVKWTIRGQMAIAITLRGFNSLGRSVTPIFLLMGHFLYRFSTFCEKRKKIYLVEVDYFAKRSIEFRSFDLFV